MMGKEDGAVLEWVNPIYGTCKLFLQAGEIPTAELGSHMLPSGGCPICGAALLRL